MLELFPACFPCSYNFILSCNSPGSDNENTVENQETMTTGELEKFMRDLSRVLGQPIFFVSKFISSAISRIFSIP